MVANPDLANLRNAKNLIDFLKGARPHDHPPRLVLNAVGMMKRPEIATAEFAKTVEIAPVAVIPHDAKLFGSAANNGQMIAEIEPKGKAAQIFVDLASAVAGRREQAKSQERLLQFACRKIAAQAGVRGIGASRLRGAVGQEGSWRCSASAEIRLLARRRFLRAS